MKIFGDGLGGMTTRTSVFNPVEQRLFGLVKIAEGLVTLFLGKRAPKWTLKVALWGAQRSAGRAR